jgi:hypothetical protein
MNHQITKLVLFLIVHIVFSEAIGNCPLNTFSDSTEYRTLNGQGNNVANPTWGSANIPFQRYGNTNSYQDSLSIPLGNPKFPHQI